MGAMSLNPAAPKGYRAYIEASPSELSFGMVDPNKSKAAGPFMSDAGGPEADDSEIPEFVDHFPDRLPVLYLRARKGAPGVLSLNNSPGRYHYDLRHITGYTTPSNQVQVGRGGSWQSGIGGTPTPTGHGLQVLGQSRSLSDGSIPPAEDPWGSDGATSSRPPYDGVMYFLNPQLNPPSPAPTPATGIPRQKDGYILISAGKDRVYGTNDDITNFGTVR
jgi:hypothetical protein